MDTTTQIDPAIANALQQVFLFIGITTLVISIILVISFWKIFTKAGVAGWKSLIPIYNIYIMIKLFTNWGVGMLLLLFIPGINAIVGIVLNIKMCECFNKGIGYVLGVIFLPVIFLPMLAFSKAQYRPPMH